MINSPLHSCPVTTVESKLKCCGLAAALISSPFELSRFLNKEFERVKQRVWEDKKTYLLARRQLFAAYCGIHYAGAETPSTPHVMSKCFKAFTPHQLGDESCRKEKNLTEVCSKQCFTTSVLFSSRSYRSYGSVWIFDSGKRGGFSEDYRGSKLSSNKGCKCSQPLDRKGQHRGWPSRPLYWSKTVFASFKNTLFNC